VSDDDLTIVVTWFVLFGAFGLWALHLGGVL
jgi:hypothetical protein